MARSHPRSKHIHRIYMCVCVQVRTDARESPINISIVFHSADNTAGFRSMACSGLIVEVASFGSPPPREISVVLNTQRTPITFKPANLSLLERSPISNMRRSLDLCRWRYLENFNSLSFTPSEKNLESKKFVVRATRALRSNAIMDDIMDNCRMKSLLFGKLACNRDFQNCDEWSGEVFSNISMIDDIIKASRNIFVNIWRGGEGRNFCRRENGRQVGDSQTGDNR